MHMKRGDSRARCCRSRTEKVWNFHFADHCFCSSFAHDKPLFSPCFDTSKAALKSDSNLSVTDAGKIGRPCYPLHRPVSNQDGQALASLRNS